MASDKLQGEAGTTVQQLRPKSAKLVAAHSRAKDGIIRTSIGGGVVILLAIAYVVALFMQFDRAQEILVVVGSSIGYLLGGSREKPDPE